MVDTLAFMPTPVSRALDPLFDQSLDQSKQYPLGIPMVIIDLPSGRLITHRSSVIAQRPSVIVSLLLLIARRSSAGHH
jgi:hypothetical protein